MGAPPGSSVGEEQRGARPGRPLLAVAGATLAGSAIGLEELVPRALCAALLLVLLFLVLGNSGAGDRPSRRALLLLLLAAGAALRAAHSRSGSSPGAPERAGGIGRWIADDGRHAAVGRLAEGSRRYELPPGAAAAGELLLLAPSGPAPRPARGPVPAPGPEAHELPPQPLAWDELARLAPARSGPAALLREGFARARDGALERIGGLREPLARGLAGALLLGERSQMPEGLPDLFTRTGTRHALAVSGLHVGLVAWLLLLPLGRLLGALAGSAPRRRPWLGPPAWRALLLLAFIPMAGGAAPVLRAGLALALAQLAPALPARAGGGARRPDALSLWSLAAALECLAAPRALLSLSFQLSYAATLGLILGAGPLTRVLRAHLPRGGELPQVVLRGRRLPARLRVPAQRALELGLASLALSAAANLATLPILWSRFGEWSAAGVLATPLLLAPLALFLGLGWLWLALPHEVLELGLELCARAMVGLLAFLDGMPGTPSPLPPRPALLLVVLAGSCLLALRSPSGGRVRAGCTRASAALGAVLLLPWTVAPRAFELHALDVGHGTAVVLRAPGAPCWIFDAGSRDRPGVAKAALAPLLRAFDVGSIAIALSHTDRDHDGALPWIVERFRTELWLGALPAAIDRRLPSGARRLDLERGAVELRTRPRAGDGLELRLLRGGPHASNEGSRSLALEHRGRRFLLCGDAEEQGLLESLRRAELRGPFELLLQPHHGSDTDWLGPFLDQTRPREVWISASRVPALVRELERRGIRWRATASEGPLAHAAPAGALAARP